MANQPSDSGAGRGHASGRWRRSIACGASAVLCGCVSVSDAQKIAAIHAVNDSFRANYEKTLAGQGTRTYPVPRRDAIVALRVALASLGMRTEQHDMQLGYLAVVADAPLPLSDAEWREASNADLPLLRTLIKPHVGLAANFVHFEPEGLDVVINATLVETPSGTDVALTVRLREKKPPPSGWPRREYLSPTVLRVGLAKIFATFETELRAGVRPT